MIEADAIVDAACQAAQSEDFGPDTWREGLDVLTKALSTEAHLNEIGVQVFTSQLIGLLVSRLEVEKVYQEHPEIDDEQIVSPLFGLGMPRTGSTALSYLLACDQSRRSLRNWESASPCPPPEEATQDTDPRIAQSQAIVDMTNQLYPDFAGMLPSSATGPMECLQLMALDMRSQLFEGMALLPSYTDWLLSCDMTPTYSYHKRVLKLLQWHCPPNRWSLKTPSHMASIDALDAVYPDARFVMTHRDIGAVIPSVCQVKTALSGPLTDQFDGPALGHHEVYLWAESLRRLIAFRDDGRESRFYDVAFAAVQTDPIAAMEKLYAELGDTLDDDTRKRMDSWWTESAKDRRRGSRPDLSAYGLDMASLQNDFAFYNDRFGISTGERAS
jgi:Sulfotransferase family